MDFGILEMADTVSKRGKVMMPFNRQMSRQANSSLEVSFRQMFLQTCYDLESFPGVHSTLPISLPSSDSLMH